MSIALVLPDFEKPGTRKSRLQRTFGVKCGHKVFYVSRAVAETCDYLSTWMKTSLPKGTMVEIDPQFVDVVERGLKLLTVGTCILHVSDVLLMDNLLSQLVAPEAVQLGFRRQLAQCILVDDQYDFLWPALFETLIPPEDMLQVSFCQRRPDDSGWPDHFKRKFRSLEEDPLMYAIGKADKRWVMDAIRRIPRDLRPKRLFDSTTALSKAQRSLVSSYSVIYCLTEEIRQVNQTVLVVVPVEDDQDGLFRLEECLVSYIDVSWTDMLPNERILERIEVEYSDLTNRFFGYFYLSPDGKCYKRYHNRLLLTFEQRFHYALIPYQNLKC